MFSLLIPEDVSQPIVKIKIFLAKTVWMAFILWERYACRDIVLFLWVWTVISVEKGSRKLPQATVRPITASNSILRGTAQLAKVTLSSLIKLA